MTVISHFSSIKSQQQLPNNQPRLEYQYSKYGNWLELKSLMAEHSDIVFAPQSWTWQIRIAGGVVTSEHRSARIMVRTTFAYRTPDCDSKMLCKT